MVSNNHVQKTRTYLHMYTTHNMYFVMVNWSQYFAINTLPFPVEIQSNLGSRTPRITNNSVYEQIFRTQSISDDIPCLELRTRKPSKCRQKQITLDNFLVGQRGPVGLKQSRVVPRDRKKKKNPLPNNNISFLTTFHLRRQLSSIQVQ